MDRKLDTTLCAAALLVVFALFLWLSVPVVLFGLSHADDAFFAVVAKSIAVGKGYGFPRSSSEFVLFDQFISTGPTLILPIACLIWVFGWVDRLPGAATLVIFISQLVVAALVLARRFGWTPTGGFLFAMLWLLMLASAPHNWYFGVFLGETVAFGFIVIGTASLAVARGDRGIAAAALCFSLAFLTKQIALFAVAGIVGAWLISSAFDRVGRAVLFRWVAILVIVGSSLPLAFEAAKLATLGLVGYRVLWSTSTLNRLAHQVIGGGGQSTRLTTFLTVLGQSYLPPALVVGLAMGSALLLVPLTRSRDEGRERVGRFATFAWAGAAVYLAYILMVSILWQRYFWIGIAVMLTAISAPMLALGSRLRVATIMVLLVGTVGFGLHQRLYLLHQWQWKVTMTTPIERAAVVRLLDDHPDLPYAAHYGSSIFDVVYLRDTEGTWTFEPNVISLQDRDFIAIINHVFTDKKHRFFESVVATCEPLTPDAQVIAAYRCGQRFWATYR
jgi:hypothetical protein